MSTVFNPADVQGNILRGYHKPRVRHLMLEVTDRAAARRWLAATTSGGDGVPQITTEEPWETKPDTCFNIGLTFDNSRFDAQSFSLTGQNTVKPAYNRMTGLLSFGGPLKIPHLLKNGPNISVNYQWTRNRNVPALQPTLVPDDKQRAGDFSATPTPIFDPRTGLAFPNNQVPVSKQASVLMALYPAPNFSSSRYNYQIPIVNNLHQDAFQGRFNKGIGRMNSISGQFAFQSVRADNTNVLGFLDTNGSLANWALAARCPCQSLSSALNSDAPPCKVMKPSLVSRLPGVRYEYRSERPVMLV